MTKDWLISDCLFKRNYIFIFFILFYVFIFNNVIFLYFAEIKSSILLFYLKGKSIYSDSNFGPYL